MLRLHYSRPTTPAGAGFDDEIANALQIGSVSGLVTAASVGEVATSSIVLDDPTGTIGHSGDGIVGLRRVYIVEDTAPAGNQVVWNGYAGVREYRRGETAGITPLGAGRQVTVELSDDNQIAHFRIITGIDGNRPAETAGARLRWLLSSAYANTIYDDGLVVYPTTAMDAVDLRGQTAADVLSDLSAVTGYNWWCAYNETTGHIQLFFDEPNISSAYTSTLQISNVSADIDATTTFAPRIDAVLRRDPSRVAAGVYLPYAKGSVYVTNYDTAYAYAFRDHAAPSGTLKTEATALTAANRFLADNASEDDRATVTVRLPASKLTAIKAGHRLQAKFSHFPAPYNGWQWWRVVRRTVTQAPLSDQAYDVTLDLSPQSILVCTYTPNSPPNTNSSVDVLGGYVTGPGSYVAASPVYPSTATITGPVTLYGTPNNGSGWGINTGVFSGGTGFVRWTWDLLAAGSPRVCSIRVTEYGGLDPNVTLQASNDGASWTTVATNAQLAAAQITSGIVQVSVALADSGYRYWALLYGPYVLPNGYFAGLDMVSVMIWRGSLA